MQILSTFLTALSFLGLPLRDQVPFNAIERLVTSTTGEYIIHLHANSTIKGVLGTFGIKATHEWESFNMFAGDLTEHIVNELRSSPQVKSISDNAIFTIDDKKIVDPVTNMAELCPLPPGLVDLENSTVRAQGIPITQNNAPWSLSRLNSRTRLTKTDPLELDFSYTYDSTQGIGVDVYVIDTGVKLDHEEFEGRATWGSTFGNFPGEGDNDVQGHGTHCAGVIAGKRFGVAKKAKIIAVKAYDRQDPPQGKTVDIVNAFNWIRQTIKPGRASIVFMAASGPANDAIDNAVKQLIDNKINVIVSAGNRNVDASGFTPVRVTNVISVGNSDILDQREVDSGYGAGLTLFAPGTFICSAGILSRTDAVVAIGSSQASALVAGLVAYIFGIEGPLEPAVTKVRLQQLGMKNCLTNIPPGSPNLLAHNTQLNPPQDSCP
ncbi:subtilisin-like protein [Pluteus cervinus]|uniref:Subtilisin-like protein n=1 Tax=Pluteus cervinus TaxID=181527 RepID=A0ACD3AB67_9AGAR|nr:subtilisin-like protein [Pluteus cervinus]